MAQSEGNMQKILNAMQNMDRDQLLQMNREVISILRHRRQRDAFRMMQQLRPGSRVRVGIIKPKYMIGVTGTVKELRQTKISFIPDAQFIGRGRYLHGGEIILPASCLGFIS